MKCGIIAAVLALALMPAVASAGGHRFGGGDRGYRYSGHGGSHSGWSVGVSFGYAGGGYGYSGYGGYGYSSCYRPAYYAPVSYCAPVYRPVCSPVYYAPPAYYSSPVYYSPPVCSTPSYYSGVSVYYYGH